MGVPFNVNETKKVGESSFLVKIPFHPSLGSDADMLRLIKAGFVFPSPLFSTLA